MLSDNSLQRLRILCAAFALVAAAGAAQAQVSGKLWEGDASSNADTVPGGPPNVTFSASAINFASGPAYTIGEWLASDGATGISYAAGSAGTDGLGDTHMQLTGSIFLNSGANAFAAGHDDGVRIVISGGIGDVLDVPGPTAFVLSPFTINNPGAAGTFTFTVDYNECCGAPADLTWQYPSGAPVGTAPDGGSTAALLGLGSTALAAWRKRR